jgi:hypothetical protein
MITSDAAQASDIRAFQTHAEPCVGTLDSKVCQRDSSQAGYVVLASKSSTCIRKKAQGLADRVVVPPPPSK